MNDGWISDLRVLSKQEGFGEDDGEERIAFEWQEELLGRGYSEPGFGDDAQVLVVRLHQDVARTQVNLIGAQVAAHDEKASFHRAAISDGEARNEPDQHLLACLSCR